MKGILGLLIGGTFFLGAGGAFAQTPPGPGTCFNGASDPPDCTTGVCATDNASCAKDENGCVPANANDAKCSAGTVKAFGKMIKCVGKCHCKQAANQLAGKPDVEEACERTDPAKSCKAKLDKALGKLASVCDSTHQTFAAAEESTLLADKNNSLSLDAQNHGSFCDSSAGSMMFTDTDDGGFVPPNTASLKCECAVAKNRTKQVSAVLKCHVKLAASFAAGKPFDEEACENAANAAYNSTASKIFSKGGCPTPCLTVASQTTLGNGDVVQVDAANNIAYPCP